MGPGQGWPRPATSAAGERLRGVLGDLVEACRLVGLAAAPFLPATAPRLLAQLGHAYPYGAGRQRRPADPRRARLGRPRRRGRPGRATRSRSSRGSTSKHGRPHLDRSARPETVRLVDSHCHLNADRFEADADQVSAAARLAGVERILVPGWNVASSERALALRRPVRLARRRGRRSTRTTRPRSMTPAGRGSSPGRPTRGSWRSARRASTTTASSARSRTS